MKSIKKCRFVDEYEAEEDDHGSENSVESAPKNNMVYMQKRRSPVSSSSECCCCKQGCPRSSKEDSNYEKIIHEKSEPIVNSRPPPMRSLGISDPIAYRGSKIYTRTIHDPLYSSNRQIKNRHSNLFRSMNNNHSAAQRSHALHHRGRHRSSSRGHLRHHSHGGAPRHHSPLARRPSTQLTSRPLRCLVGHEGTGCRHGRDHYAASCGLR